MIDNAAKRRKKMLFQQLLITALYVYSTHYSLLGSRGFAPGGFQGKALIKRKIKQIPKVVEAEAKKECEKN